nr:limonene cyclase like protein [Ipomoea batatas]
MKNRQNYSLELCKTVNNSHHSKTRQRNKNSKTVSSINGSGAGRVSGSSSKSPFSKVGLCGASVPFLGDPCTSSQPRVTQPVDPRVVADCSVGRINQYYLIVLGSRRNRRKRLGTNLVNPVRVQNPETTEFPASALLSNRAFAPLKFQLSHTLVCGLAINNTLGNGTLSTPTSHTNSIDDIAL